ncbi:MAG: hypothetical protein WA152_03540 [Microgenomates group bacterium]
MDTNTKSQINFIAKPAAILGVIVLLFILVLTFGMKQITTVRTKIAAGNKSEATLRQKAQTLETVAEILPGDVTFLDVVLPSKGSVLYGLSQIKNQALSNSIALSSLKTGTQIPESDGVSKISISFDAEGEEQSIYNFLNSFSKLLPLMNVDKVSLNKSGDLARASVSVSVYSSELPKKIPALTESVKELTKDEIATLTELATYGMPQFVEPEAANSNSTKTDPFN